MSEHKVEATYHRHSKVTVLSENLYCVGYHNKYMLFAGWEVRIGKDCAQGLEYDAGSAG